MRIAMDNPVLQEATRTIASIWGKCPSSFPGPLFSEADTWEIAQRSCHDFRHGRACDNIKLYADGRQIISDLHRLLPDEGDETFVDYADRILKQASAKEFLFYSSGCQRTAGDAIVSRVEAFLRPLFDRVGYPEGRVELEVFGGVYNDTPGGIHREACHNLQFVTRGSKEMHIWQPQQWQVDERSSEPMQKELAIYPAEFLDRCTRGDATNSQCVAAAPGEVMYWPPYHWHVGTSPQLSLANVICIYPQSTIEDGLDAVAAMLRSVRPEVARSGGTLEEISTVLNELGTPGRISQIVEAMKNERRAHAGLHFGY
jgi:hypothetical protein